MQCWQADRQRPVIRRSSRLPKAHRLCAHLAIWRWSSGPCQAQARQGCSEEGRGGRRGGRVNASLVTPSPYAAISCGCMSLTACQYVCARFEPHTMLHLTGLLFSCPCDLNRVHVCLPRYSLFTCLAGDSAFNSRSVRVYQKLLMALLPLQYEICLMLLNLVEL